MDRLTQPLEASVRACLLIAMLAPTAGFPQVASEPSLEPELRIVEEIERETTQNGPYSEQLIGPLLSLSILYDESGNDPLFEATIERVLQVIRANYGLYSLEQAPIIRQLIQRAEERGNAVTAWELEQGLLGVAERHGNDIRAAQILRDTGDRRLALLRRYDTGTRPPEIILGCYYDDSGEYLRAWRRGSRPIFSAPVREMPNKCVAGSRRQARRAIFVEAQSYYNAAIDIMLANEEQPTELRDAIWDVVRSAHRYEAPNVGKRALQLLHSVEATGSEDWLARLEARVLIADHDLLYSPIFGTKDRDAALAEYREAYRLMAEHGIAEQSIRENFAPEFPIVLPAYAHNPLVSPESPESTGHIDVSFDIGEDGKSSNIRILDSTSNASKHAERDVVATIEANRFRPRVEDGQLVDPATVTVRYYLDE